MTDRGENIFRAKEKWREGTRKVARVFAKKVRNFSKKKAPCSRNIRYRGLENVKSIQLTLLFLFQYIYRV